jgi:hypothetical protein
MFGTPLFLADIPDQVQFLTIYGKLKMGLRDANGGEVAVQIANSAYADPIADLNGPRNGDIVGIGSVNNRGYIDVTYTVPSGNHLDADSVLDLAAEFNFNIDTLKPDSTQAPVLINESNNTFRYWLAGFGTPASAAFLENSWFYVNDTSAVETLNGAAAISSLDFSKTNSRYLDVIFNPSSGAELNFSTITGDEFTLGGTGANGAVILGLPTRLGETNTYRYFLTNSFVAGQVIVTFNANRWQDSLGRNNIEEIETFTVSAPLSEVSGPFAGSSTDVTILNTRLDADTGKKYIDVVFKPAPGSKLAPGDSRAEPRPKSRESSHWRVPS